MPGAFGADRALTYIGEDSRGGAFLGERAREESHKFEGTSLFLYLLGFRSERKQAACKCVGSNEEKREKGRRRVFVFIYTYGRKAFFSMSYVSWYFRWVHAYMYRDRALKSSRGEEMHKKSKL